MTVVLSPTPVFRGVDNLGLALVGGKLFTYIAGTTTPQATWVDSTQTTQNTNPVILNARGEANVWLDPTLTYKYVLMDSANNPVGSVDNIRGAPSTSGPSVFTPAFLFAGGGTVNYTAQEGHYTVIGNVCTFSIRLTWTGTAAPVGLVSISLPVATKFNVAFAVGYTLDITIPTGTGSMGIAVSAGQTTGLIYILGTSAPVLAGSNFLASGDGSFIVTGSYQV